MLPFDAHNHVHMGPSSAMIALHGPPDGPLANKIALSGMAIMSTHPRDYDKVQRLFHELARPGVAIVPCFGVHPWWLHELTDDDWKVCDVSSSSEYSYPLWISQLEEKLLSNEGSILGEMGLDGFHFDPVTKQLTSPMEKQIAAFRYQLELAARLQIPVSIHAVQCFGHLMEILSDVKKSKAGLPPKLYFHAFGGKMGVVDQLTAICGRKCGQCYFGFAPVINFLSPKTAEVIRKVGIDRLVLETDHEDAALVPESITEGIRFLAHALNMDEKEIVERTTENAYDLYGLRQKT